MSSRAAAAPDAAMYDGRRNCRHECAHRLRDQKNHSEIQHDLERFRFVSWQPQKRSGFSSA